MVKRKKKGYDVMSEINAIVKAAMPKKRPTKKQMTWPQAKKKYPNLDPLGNADGDIMPNMIDCSPFDFDKQERFYFWKDNRGRVMKDDDGNIQGYLKFNNAINSNIMNGGSLHVIKNTNKFKRVSPISSMMNKSSSGGMIMPTVEMNPIDLKKSEFEEVNTVLSRTKALPLDVKKKIVTNLRARKDEYDNYHSGYVGEQIVDYSNTSDDKRRKKLIQNQLKNIIKRDPRVRKRLTTADIYGVERKYHSPPAIASAGDGYINLEEPFTGVGYQIDTKKQKNKAERANIAKHEIVHLDQFDDEGAAEHRANYAKESKKYGYGKNKYEIEANLVAFREQVDLDYPNLSNTLKNKIAIKRLADHMTGRKGVDESRYRELNDKQNEKQMGENIGFIQGGDYADHREDASAEDEEIYGSIDPKNARELYNEEITDSKRNMLREYLEEKHPDAPEDVKEDLISHGQFVTRSSPKYMIDKNEYMRLKGKDESEPEQEDPPAIADDWDGDGTPNSEDENPLYPIAQYEDEETKEEEE